MASCMGREVKGEEFVNVNIHQSGKFRSYCMGREEFIGEYLVCTNEIISPAQQSEKGVKALKQKHGSGQRLKWGGA